MTYNPKSIQELVREIEVVLINQNSSLNDLSEGSVLSGLIRSIASAQQKQELSLERVLTSFYTSSASGIDLNVKAEDIGLQRKSGSAATGSVLAVSQEGPVSISGRLLLTDPVSGVQLRVRSESNNILISSDIERRIPVYAVLPGSRGNLKQETRLISPAYAGINFIVGSHKTSTGKVCGDLTGGKDAESDEELRERITSFTLNSRGTTDAAIIGKLLEDPSILWASISSSPGLVNAWVDSASTLSQKDILRLKSIAEVARPSGVLLSVNQAKRGLTDINVFIKPTRDADLKVLTERVSNLVKAYLQSLKLEEPLSREALRNQVYFLEGVVEAEIEKPSEDFYPGEFSIVRTNTVLVSYDTI